MLDEALADVKVRAAVDRLARLARRTISAWGSSGNVLRTNGSGDGHMTQQSAKAGASIVLDVGGVGLGMIACSGPEDEVSADLLDAVKELLVERVKSEADKNQLAGDILSKLQELSVLYDVSDALANARDIGAVAEEVLAHAAQVISPEWSAFISHDPERSEARVVATRGVGEAPQRGWCAVEPGCFTWQALSADEPILVPELSDTDRMKLRRDVGSLADRMTTLLAVPTCAGGRARGVVLLLNGPGRAPFTSMDARLVRALASQAAVSASHLGLYQESKDMFLSTVWSLASAVDAKDAYTHGHSRRVAQYSSALGHAMGFDAREIERLELSAILHDVGKIGVPEAVLNKPDRLTAAEMAVMRTHPERGAEILASIRAMRDIVPGVLHHHERFDGKGYPNGLKGENIPLIARIILVADTFDAMTSSRPYRSSLPVQVAIDEIRRCISTQFDPRLAEVFVDLAERGIIRPVESPGLHSARLGGRQPHAQPALR